ncbi:MAG: response regulator transcription factor [Sedimentibacter sp.]|uniref:response regulator transcription factor n=1 Tax=Sedimentibacter sp. TaxID=1960295 RepID=UPI0031588160
MYRILIVDDECKIREVIREYAEFEGFCVTEASNGLEAVNLCRDNDFDIIVMDIMMPKIDGYYASREIKKTKDIPIIMLSARGEEYDKLHGFDIGIDDYVVKPFSPKELIARLNVIMRRNSKSSRKEESAFKYSGLEIDMAGRGVYIDGVKADLTPKEYDLLVYLIKNRNVALSREKILSDVWGYDFYGIDRTVDTHIKMLRNNLGKYRNLILTIRGMGYKLETRGTFPA